MLIEKVFYIHIYFTHVELQRGIAAPPPRIPRRAVASATRAPPTPADHRRGPSVSYAQTTHKFTHVLDVPILALPVADAIVGHVRAQRKARGRGCRYSRCSRRGHGSGGRDRIERGARALDRRRERDPGGRGRVEVEQNVVSRRVSTTGRVRVVASIAFVARRRHARAARRRAAGNPGVRGAGGADQARAVGERVEEQARELLAEPQRREGREGVAHDDEKQLVELEAQTFRQRRRRLAGLGVAAARATATVTGARRGAARGAWRAEMREKASVEVEDGK